MNSDINNVEIMDILEPSLNLVNTQVNTDLYLQDLLQSIDEQDVIDLGLTKETFVNKIQNVDQANFYIKKIKDLQAQIDDIESTAKRYLDKKTSEINHWKETKTKSFKNTIDFYNSILERFTDDYLKDAKTKTIKLPEGTLSFKENIVYDYYDEEKIINFLKENNKSLLRSKNEIIKVDFKKAVTIKNNNLVLNEKIIPGVSVENQRKFKIEK